MKHVRRERRGRWAAILVAVMAAGGMAMWGDPAVSEEGASSPLDLATVEEGQVISGFQAQAIYFNDRDQVMGARFGHIYTGFVVDLLQIESVPQAFIWISTIPDSDRGEPHTLEHLVLGKGNRARAVSALEDMSLVSSSAFTGRDRTCYHFNTVAGADVFFEYLERRLQSLLEPDYDDEEIRREVHHFNVSSDSDGSLRLEEGGTVYTEMVSSYERPGYRLWHDLTIAAFGPDHPLAQDSGGLPEAIREMTVEHVRRFQQDHYRLGNMGMIAALPSAVDPGSTLERMDALLLRLQHEMAAYPVQVMTLDTLPAAAPVLDPPIRHVPYPSQEAQDTVDLEYVWPATLELSTTEIMLLEHFLATVAGAANTNLYKRLIGGDSRELETGATSLSAWVSEWPGHFINLTLGGIPYASLDDTKVMAVRGIVLDELRQIASWEADDERLIDFNRRLMSNFTASQREIRDFLDSPPRFGYRSVSDRWLGHLDRLASAGGFRRSLSFRQEAEEIRDLMSRPENIWTTNLERWGLLSTVPIALIPEPSPELQARLQAEREARLSEQTERLMTEYGTDEAAMTEQETHGLAQALARFKGAYDAETERLNAIASQVSIPPFIDNPPYTLDDTLSYRVGELEPAGIPLISSEFPNMSGATVGLNLRLDGVAEEDLFLLAMLPGLVRQVGVVDGDQAIRYDEMIERLQNEVLDLSVAFSTDFPTGRVELSLQGRGTNLEETRAALRWMGLVLYHADWRPENVSRIRDLVSETLDLLRVVMQRSEESWVNNPFDAYRWQTNPLILATSSFLTSTHNVHRLRWMLTDAESTEQLAVLEGALQALGELGSELDREGLSQLLVSLKGSLESLPEIATGAAALSSLRERWGELSEASRALMIRAAEDLELTMSGLPDETLAADWAYLCREMAIDLATPSATVLERLTRIRQRLLTAAGSRLYAVGAAQTLSELEPQLAELVSGLETGAEWQPAQYSDRHLILERLAERASVQVQPAAGDRSGDSRPATDDASGDAQPVADDGSGNAPPVFVGLVNPDTQGGVFINSAPAVTYRDTDPESLINYMTGLTFGGGGNHGVFMNTWAAGLAYSNGVGADLTGGFIRYYAERCPELPQTLRFVINLLQSAEEDPARSDYALALAFSSRAAGRYEARGLAIANDIADSRPPELIRAFREGLMALRSRPDLAAELHRRRLTVYSPIFPGLVPYWQPAPGAVYLVIGPERQIALYEEYLQGIMSPATRVARLFPRDFWMTAAQ